MIHHLIFAQCAQCSWTFRSSLQVCSGRLCHLEKIAFWAIIEGPFAGYAFLSCQESQDSQSFFCPNTSSTAFFLSQPCCFFAPVFLVHGLAVWVTLALQNMPPKARAPEARMVFEWDQVSGVEFCDVSPQYLLAIIESSIFVCSPVASLVVSHH